MKDFFRSFVYAFRGLVSAFRKQRNIKVQLAVGTAVVVWSLVIRLPAMEFAVILFVCFFVIILETLNTALEKTVDLVSPRYNKKAGEIKDMSAGTVLLAAVLSIIMGIWILWKPSVDFLVRLFRD